LPGKRLHAEERERVARNFVRPEQRVIGCKERQVPSKKEKRLLLGTGSSQQRETKPYYILTQYLDDSLKGRPERMHKSLDERLQR
jgi:hypothetical protein